MTNGIRVTAEEEFGGLDINEHGMEAYTGFLSDPLSEGSSGSVYRSSESLASEKE
jgi:Amt family ammonium transporter